MCIRDRGGPLPEHTDDERCEQRGIEHREELLEVIHQIRVCLLYTSDAADERSSVDLGGRRIIKKKKHR